MKKSKNGYFIQDIRLNNGQIEKLIDIDQLIGRSEEEHNGILLAQVFPGKALLRVVFIPPNIEIKIMDILNSNEEKHEETTI
jgi:hypothetical protein